MGDEGALAGFNYRDKELFIIDISFLMYLMYPILLFKIESNPMKIVSQRTSTP